MARGMGVLWLCVAWLGLCVSQSLAATERPVFVRGAEFRKAWSSPVRVRLDRAPLRSAMQQLCFTAKIAWVMDRRLDPDRGVSWTPEAAIPLSEFLPELLRTIQADCVVVGDTVIVGPEASIKWLRTLAEIQRTELQAKAGSAKLVQSLGRPLDLHWDELAEPRSLVSELTQRAKVSLTGADLIPYDLWGSGDLVGLTPGEALTVFAWQYDLQLQWEAGGKASLVPLKLPVAVSRLIPVAAAKREAAKSQFPDLASVPEGQSWRVSGRVEELETFELWLKGGIKPLPRPKQTASDWRTRKFTFKVEKASLIDVLNGLKQQGTAIHWDEKALIDAGVDLKVPLQIDLQGASADEFLSAICDPAKLRYVITAEGATISPP